MDLQINFNGQTVPQQELADIAQSTGATISLITDKFVTFTGLEDWSAVDTQLQALKTRLPAEYSKYRYSDGFMGEEDILLQFNIQYNY